MESFWGRVEGPELAQGDFLTDCSIPLFPAGFGRVQPMSEMLFVQADLIVVTQTCDLLHGKADIVALCSIRSISEFEEANPAYRQRGRWEEVRKGRAEGLHLLGSTVSPENNREALVVDFGQIVSLPFEYLSFHAGQLETRWRLISPYLEHFSQAFARFFMRVGLPSAIPPFK